VSKRSLYSAGLVAAILSTLSWFAFIFGQLSLPHLSAIDDPLQYFQMIQDSRSVFLLYGWGGVVGTLLTVPYIVAFYEAIKDAGPMVLLSMIVALIGVVLATFGFFKPLTTVYEYVPLGLEASPEALPSLKVAAAVSVGVFEIPWALGSFLLFGLGFGLIAYYAWRTATGPKWLNVVGLAAGLSGIVWLTPFLPFLEPVATFLRFLNILTIMIWSIGLSVVLVRLIEPEVKHSEGSID
jgi:hypothetical protein